MVDRENMDVLVVGSGVIGATVACSAAQGLRALLQ
jgi:glycine/D-amino acid oxidase-like deaminating enzyme